MSNEELSLFSYILLAEGGGHGIIKCLPCVSVHAQVLLSHFYIDLAIYEDIQSILQGMLFAMKPCL